jgi:hypothetical protein
MKTFIKTSILALLLIAASALTAQNNPDEYLGLPGDNLNLYAVMDLFQKSETLEAFERGLNNPELIINNLDLNNDNLVDFIMVYDFVEGDIHSIVLRVAISKDEYQDVAVFTVQKFSNGAVQIQLIGDENLYGKDYIVEPIYAETPNPGYRGDNYQQNSNIVETSYYEVAEWPVIVNFYLPTYRPYYSLWSWGYYPEYWTAWDVYYWHFYYGYHSNWHTHYYTYYRPWRHHRCDYYHRGYYGHHRHHSTIVASNVSYGRYRGTYSRPERKPEGERLFHQKYPGGTNVAVQGNRTKPRVERPTTETEVNGRPAGSRTGNAAVTNTKIPTRETDAINRTDKRTVVGKPNVTTTESATSNDNIESKPVRIPSVTRPREERTTTQSRDNSSSIGNRTESESKPRVNRETSSSSVERPIPQRQESKPERRVETRQETKPQTRVETRQENKPERRVETRQESKPERRVETRQESKPVRTETKESKSESSEKKSTSTKSSESSNNKKR